MMVELVGAMRRACHSPRMGSEGHRIIGEIAEPEDAAAVLPFPARAIGLD
jgi:hypothetical protein